MKQSAALTTRTQRRLRRLRLQVTALIAVLVAVCVAIFAILVVRLDAQVRSEELDRQLLAQSAALANQVTFADGSLEPGNPTGLLDSNQAIGVRPSFDIVDAVDRLDLWEWLPEPTDQQLTEFRRKEFEDLFDEEQSDALEEAGATSVNDLLSDPPEWLADEAYRAYLWEVAEDADVDLGLDEVTVFLAADSVLDRAAAEEAFTQLVDEDASGQLDIESGDTRLVGRGVVVRDGFESRGALIVAVDPSGGEADSARFRRSVWALALGLVALAAAAAWFISGRTTRPVAHALSQQERFLADAAHELRTPIAAIRSTAEGSGTERGLDERLVRVGELAADAGALTNDLLALAQMDADRVPLNLEPARVDYLMEAVIDGDSAFELTAVPVTLSVDVALLTRAFDNLLRNARIHGKATQDRPAKVSVDATKITVTDSGPGFGETDPEFLFERFASTSSAGHGLGLPLARWIAEAHGGRLWAEPAHPDGMGARFVLTINNH